MMQRFAWRIAIGIIAACVVLLPALAQRSGTAKVPIITLQGKVLEVNAQQHTASVVFYVHAPSMNAPGKVPEEIARHIRRMTTRLNTELQRHRSRRC